MIHGLLVVAISSNVRDEHGPRDRPGGKGRWKLVVRRTSPRAGDVEPSGTKVGLTMVYMKARK
jgi:hypothetical protein